MKACVPAVFLALAGITMTMVAVNHALHDGCRPADQRMHVDG
jgi:hypothetical protein